MSRRLCWRWASPVRIAELPAYLWRRFRSEIRELNRIGSRFPSAMLVPERLPSAALVQNIHKP